MTGPGARTPPRFVPTLTTVLDLPAAGPGTASVPAQERAAATAPAAGAAIALDPQARLSDADAFRVEEQLLHRVLQRIDLSLEMKLSDAVSAAVQHQLDLMIPRLRAEIEAVLRSLVVEALARELSDNTGSATADGVQSLG